MEFWAGLRRGAGLVEELVHIVIIVEVGWVGWERWCWVCAAAGGCQVWCRLKSEAEWSFKLCWKDGGEREPALRRAREADRGRRREGRDGTRCYHVSGSGNPESARLDLGKLR